MNLDLNRGLYFVYLFYLLWLYDIICMYRTEIC